MVASAALKLSVAFSVLPMLDAANSKCPALVYPNGAHVTAGSDGFAALNACSDGNCDNQCASGTPALKLDEATDVNNLLANVGTAKTTCCAASPTCGTSYYEKPLSITAAVANKEACPVGAKLQSDEKCITVSKGDVTKCGIKQPITYATLVAVDTDKCCRMPCSAKFKLKDASGENMIECPAGDYQVSSSALCAKSSCVSGTDTPTCCQKKCAKAVVLADGDTTATGVEVACKSDTADKISSTAFCTKSTCKDTDTQCCQQKCGDGFVLHGTTDTGTSNGGFAKIACDEGLFVNTDDKAGFCAKTKCSSGDAKTCCLTKCDAAKGWELFGGKTDGKFQCSKDLRVHPTGKCKGTDCKSSESVCCQQKCTAGFKLKGATGTGTECDAGLTVHASAYCKGKSCSKTDDAGTCCQQSCSKGFKLHGATTKEANTCAKDTTLASDIKCAGSPCAATDIKLCCNEKCTHTKNGFKVKGAKTKEANECKDKETVGSKAMCAGDCSSDDAKTCCLKENKTATTDAHSAGLASVVGMLLVLSTVS